MTKLDEIVERIKQLYGFETSTGTRSAQMLVDIEYLLELVNEKNSEISELAIEISELNEYIDDIEQDAMERDLLL